MSTVLQVAPHLSTRDLRHRFERCRDVPERDRLHCVLLKMQGRSSAEIAAFFYKKEDWVRRTVRRYNAGGPAALKSGRHGGGRRRLLTAEDEAALRLALAAPPPDGGLWSGPKVADWLQQRKGHSCSKHLGWITLRRLGFTVQRPRPSQPESDPKAREAFKKGGSQLTFKVWLTPIPTP